ncbi:hydrogenase nickel incorporation protein HypB [bacterium]|nr:hydrogenase nickel incorporation protein HypB [bacterium]
MPEKKEITVEENVLDANRRLALANLDTLNRKHIRSLDILGSIGSGKTSIVKQCIRRLKKDYRIAAIAGDLTTTIDADRIKEEGAPVLQINTGGQCHLDAAVIGKTLKSLNLDDLDLILIENVGNLICPGSFPLGTHDRMVVVSVTEGPYMVVKHPYIFMDASVLAINKMDLAEIMGVDMNRLKSEALQIKPDIKVVFTNAKTGEGIENLIDALNLKPPRHA